VHAARQASVNPERRESRAGIGRDDIERVRRARKFAVSRCNYHRCGFNSMAVQIADPGNYD
jgi:hypothetical protein